MSTTINELAKLLKSDDKKGDTSFWGVVQSTITDGQGNVTGYNVSLDSGGQTGVVKCNKVVGAKQGDQVLVTLRANGEAVVVATKGGDTDVQDVATNLDTNYYDKAETEALIATTASGSKIYYQASAPSGGTYKIGDTWFDTDDGYCIYEWNGSTWIKCQLDSGAIKAGAIKASQIDAGAVTAAKLAVGAIQTIGSDEDNYATMDSDGLTIYKGGSEIASFEGLNATIGNATSEYSCLKIGNGMEISSYLTGLNQIDAVGALLVNNGLVVAGPITCTGLNVGGASPITYSDFSVSSVSWTTSSTSSGSSLGLTAQSATMSGYYPLGVVGVESGAFRANVNCYLSSRGSGSATVGISGCAAGGSVSSGQTIKAYILWVKM